MSELEEQLSRWRGAGLLTPSQADAIREFEKLSFPLRGEVPGGEADRGRRTVEPPAPPPSSPPGPHPNPPRQAGRGFVVDARVLGGILTGLALLAMVGAVFALATDVVVAPNHHWSTGLEDVAHAVAAALGLTGGLRMAGGRADGRRLVLVSLGFNLAATLLLSTSRLAEATTFLPVLAWLVLAALTWYSRFPKLAVATRSQVG